MIDLKQHNELMSEMGIDELIDDFCESCEGTGRIQLEPDSTIYHPCDTCCPEMNDAWQAGFNAKSDDLRKVREALVAYRDSAAVKHPQVTQRGQEALTIIDRIIGGGE